MTSRTSRDTVDADRASFPGGSQSGQPRSTQTPTDMQINEHGSPTEEGGTRCTKLLPQGNTFSSCVTGFDDVFAACSDGPVLGADPQPLVRVFDPKKDLKYRNVPKDLQLCYNRDRSVLHLRGYNPLTGTITTDPGTIVISIDAVVYEDGPAAAAVFFHPKSPWNLVTEVEATKDNAKLQALYIALCIISSANLNCAPFRAAYIRCADLEFCHANANDNLKGAQSNNKFVDGWLQGADQALLSEIRAVVMDVTTKVNGSPPVDVYLWPVSQEEIEPVTEMGNVYMHEVHDRDWYKENDRDPDRLRVDGPAFPVYDSNTDLVARATATLKEYLLGFTTDPPASLVSEGARAVSVWKAQTVLNLRQALLATIVASDGCWLLNKDLRAKAGLMTGDEFLEGYGMMERYTAQKERIQELIADFVKDQRGIRSNASMNEQQMPDTGSNDGEHDGEAKALIAQVVALFKAHPD